VPLESLEAGGSKPSSNAPWVTSPLLLPDRRRSWPIAWVAGGGPVDLNDSATSSTCPKELTHRQKLRGAGDHSPRPILPCGRG